MLFSIFGWVVSWLDQVQSGEDHGSGLLYENQHPVFLYRYLCLLCLEIGATTPLWSRSVSPDTTENRVDTSIDSESSTTERLRTIHLRSASTFDPVREHCLSSPWIVDNAWIQNARLSLSRKGMSSHSDIPAETIESVEDQYSRVRKALRVIRPSAQQWLKLQQQKRICASEQSLNTAERAKSDLLSNEASSKCLGDASSLCETDFLGSNSIRIESSTSTDHDQSVQLHMNGSKVDERDPILSSSSASLQASSNSPQSVLTPGLDPSVPNTSFQSPVSLDFGFQRTEVEENQVEPSGK